jgi:hypothetical protein
MVKQKGSPAAYETARRETPLLAKLAQNLRRDLAG